VEVERAAAVAAAVQGAEVMVRATTEEAGPWAVATSVEAVQVVQVRVAVVKDVGAMGEARAAGHQEVVATEVAV